MDIPGGLRQDGGLAEAAGKLIPHEGCSVPTEQPSVFPIATVFLTIGEQIRILDSRLIIQA